MSARSHLRGIALACAVCVVAAAPPTQAQPAPSGDPASAETLFERARTLWKAGRFEEACGSFAESHRLDPGVGVLLYLGDCYVKIGRTASAWAAYREVVPAAKSLGQMDRVRAAEEKLVELEPKLVRIAIAVPTSTRVAGLEVRRDGIVVPEPLWGVEVPVDPGDHVVEAHAPGKRAWSTRTDARGEGRTLTVNVPELATEEPAPTQPVWVAPPPAAPPRPAGTPTPSDGAPRGPSTLRIAGFAVGAVGAAAVAGAIVTGAFVVAERAKLDEHCDAQKRCDEEGVRAASSAETLGVGNTVLWSLGAVGLGTGLVLVLVGDRQTSQRAAVAAGISFDGAVRLRGAF